MARGKYLSGKMADTWPKHGPDFNAWESDFRAFCDMLADASDEAWWGRDWQLKYLQIRIDTRDCGFILSDRDGNRVDPMRVKAAIEKHRKAFGGQKLNMRYYA